MNVLVFVAFICHLVNLTSGQENNYGPYDLSWDVFEKCKGPKQKDCGFYEIVDSRNMSDVTFRFEFENACPITTARITISTFHQNSNNAKKLFNYALEKPCQHFVMGPILISSFNLTNSCKVNKGHYDIHINMMDKSNTFLGPNFFFGTYSFKVTATNKVQNFICVHSVMNVDKRLN